MALFKRMEAAPNKNNRSYDKSTNGLRRPSRTFGRATIFRFAPIARGPPIGYQTKTVFDGENSLYPVTGTLQLYAIYPVLASASRNSHACIMSALSET